MIPKLRAWDKEDERMSYGELEYFDDSINYRFEHFCTGADEDVEFMQSTGLKDKNGTEIYEGDVIANQNKESKNWYVSHHVVVWHDTGFMGKQICSSGSYLGLDYWTSGENGYVVIGNIYENPELLEDTKNESR
ncbi:YopX family protein [Lactococcus lactis]|uniref:YopX family protein n=2 Tax=Lactococcus lactis TaxID=1358 RepID=A0AAE4NPP6_9LACT|nr:YopX family protein [Lactococcus lactis]MDV2632349.1 YopX family protein [Lactococcus lactis]